MGGDPFGQNDLNSKFGYGRGGVGSNIGGPSGISTNNRNGYANYDEPNSNFGY
jgi:hypothetical protein